MSSDITAFDAFCGAGGSSTGLVAAGIRVTGAANHWALAIETHNTNHPSTDHFLDDLQRAHPSWFPHATMAWFSPECTNHSLAKGKKRKAANQMDLWGEEGIDPAEERSRATMREVVEFTAFHRYEVVIVENVVDIRYWQHYDAWLSEMLSLGYDYKVLYLNAQFFGVPQSRDRFYAVFWKRGNRAPNLDFRPPATCPTHGEIGAVQVFKKAEFPWGRYGARRQYVYRCPLCGADVMPRFRPAADVIDWSIPSQRIGDRERPLKPRTVERIKAGLRKFGRKVILADLAHNHAVNAGKVSAADEPMPTQTTRQTLSMVDPFLTSQHDGRNPLRALDEPLWCVTSMNNEQQLVVPPFLINQRCTDTPSGIANPIALDEPLRSIVTVAQHALITPPFLAVLKHSWSPDGKYLLPPLSLDDPLTTIVAGASQHALITPFIAELRKDSVARSTDEPLATITAGGGHHGLVMSYYGENTVFAPTDEPLPTMRTVSHEALIEVDELLPECGFRMLEPEELKRGMSFPNEYVILGNKRDQVRQVGNAVACNVARVIAERCVESLQ